LKWQLTGAYLKITNRGACTPSSSVGNSQCHHDKGPDLTQERFFLRQKVPPFFAIEAKIASQH
jgi:hypothetical protein